MIVLGRDVVAQIKALRTKEAHYAEKHHLDFLQLVNLKLSVPVDS